MTTIFQVILLMVFLLILMLSTGLLRKMGCIRFRRRRLIDIPIKSRLMVNSNAWFYR